MSGLTHFNSRGEARMVDVGDKPITRRVAVAEGYIRMQAETLALIAGGGHKKGDVLGVARVAGIMAAKKTAELVPLCHPLSLSKVEIDLATVEDDDSVYCQATVETTGLPPSAPAGSPWLMDPGKPWAHIMLSEPEAK